VSRAGPQRPASLREVAKLASVSAGTVSRVLNGHPSVSRELTARVEKAIQDLDYRPDPLARSLRSRTTTTLGLVVPDITNPFFAELAKHIELAAAERGYQLLLANSLDSPDVERQSIENFRARRVDGLVVVPAGDTLTADVGEEMRVVVVDRQVPGLPRIAADHVLGARSAVEYLASLDHRRIACIAGPQTLSTGRDRYEGYRQVATGLLGMTTGEQERLTRFGAFDYVSGRDAARSLLTLPEPPTAIFASSDQQAIGALHAAVQMGIPVPDRLSIVGFDDVPLAELVHPALTTVSQPIKEIAVRAVSLLLRDDDADPRIRLLVDTHLVVRDSCAPPPSLP
jgi:LacI family transcriptional regulator